MLLLGCSAAASRPPDDAGTNDASADIDTGTDTGDLACADGDFDVAPIEWVLPVAPEIEGDHDVYAAFSSGAPDSGGTCIDTEGRWIFTTQGGSGFGELGDIHHYQHLGDLVIADDCVLGGAGRDYWHVHRRQVDGFAQEPISIALPNTNAEETTDPFSMPLYYQDGAWCADESGYMMSDTDDLDGDGWFDLILLKSCDDPEVGQTSWLVYFQDDTGLDTPGQHWVLPTVDYSGTGEQPFGSLTLEWDCLTEGGWSFVLVDMDGDDLLDLVVTDYCDDAGVGTTHWDVYYSDGSGFADTAISWPLPEVATSDDHFDSLLDDYGGPDGPVLFDMNGDDRPDLVRTSGTGDLVLGLEFWHVHLNSGAGFDPTPIEWSLPPTPLDGKVYISASMYWRTCGEPGTDWRYRTLDMNNDGRPDLVVTDDCELGGVGETHWSVHLNNGSGFDHGALAWCLPPIPSSGGLYDPFSRDTYACFEGLPIRFTAIDATEDGCVDLVVTDDCEVGGIGDSHWLVYPMPCIDLE